MNRRTRIAGPETQVWVRVARPLLRQNFCQKKSSHNAGNFSDDGAAEKVRAMVQTCRCMFLTSETVRRTAISGFLISRRRPNENIHRTRISVSGVIPPEAPANVVRACYLQRLREWYNLCSELSYEDLCIPPRTDHALVEWDTDAERVARLADANGLDGNLFRDYLLGEPDPDPLSRHTANQLARKIETIPRIIAKIEQSGPVTLNTPTPSHVKLLSVPQVAEMLGCGESTLREMDRKGRVPRPIRLGGLIRWNVDEIKAWLELGCPPRAEWERNRNNWMKEVNDATA